MRNTYPCGAAMVSDLRGSRITLDHVWRALPVLLSFGMLCLAPLREGDLWWHLQVGESIFRRQALPAVDEWTVGGAGRPPNAEHSWLSDVVLYMLETLGGLAALVTLQAVVGAATIGLCVYLGYRAGRSAQLTSVLSLGGFLALYPFSTTRPQIFSFLLFAIVQVVLLEAYAGRKRWLWLLPVAMALWVNLHGGWVMGCGLVCIFILGCVVEALSGRRTWRSLRPLWLWAAATMAATSINPQGLRVYRYLVVMGQSPISQRFVSEWQPPALSQAFTWPFWGLVLTAVILVVLRRPRDWDVPLLVALPFTALALRYVRMVPFAAIALMPPLYARLPRQARARVKGSPANAALLTVFVLLALGTIPHIRLAAGASPSAFIDPDFPVAACEVLAEAGATDGGVFTLAEWGGYVSWRLAPRLRAFVDGRVELYPVSLWGEYFSITTGQGDWESLVRQWDLDYLLLSLERQQQLLVAARNAGWRSLHEDAKSILLERP